MLPFLGGIASGIASLFGTQSTNQQSAANQAQMEAYNTSMSNTAYQRASADMKAAGLNPAMMFSSGSAASTPSAPGIQFQNPGAAVGSGIQSAVALKTADATVDKMAEEVAQMKTNEVLQQAQTETEKSRPDLLRAEAAKAMADTTKSEQEAQNVEAVRPVLQNEALTARNEQGMNSSARRILDVGGYGGMKVGKVLSPIFDLAGSASAVKYLSKGY